MARAAELTKQETLLVADDDHRDLQRGGGGP